MPGKKCHRRRRESPPGFVRMPGTEHREEQEEVPSSSRAQLGHLCIASLVDRTLKHYVLTDKELLPQVPATPMPQRAPSSR